MFLCKTCASLFYAFAIFYTPPDVSCYAGAVLLEEKKNLPQFRKLLCRCVAVLLEPTVTWICLVTSLYLPDELWWRKHFCDSAFAILQCFYKIWQMCSQHPTGVQMQPYHKNGSVVLNKFWTNGSVWTFFSLFTKLQRWLQLQCAKANVKKPST